MNELTSLLKRPVTVTSLKHSKFIDNPCFYYFQLLFSKQANPKISLTSEKKNIYFNRISSCYAPIVKNKMQNTFHKSDCK